MNVAEILVAELQDRGVKYISTLNGHGLDPFALACIKLGMNMIDVRNEQTASYMAEVTGRLTRNVGVCAVSGAVAHANALTGVLNAHLDGAPMLLITGVLPLSRFGERDFQDFNPVPMAKPICKYAQVIDNPNNIDQIIEEAFSAATSGKPGPVHLSLPMDIAEKEVENYQKEIISKRRCGVELKMDAKDSEIDRVSELIRISKKPLIIAGSGLYYSFGEKELIAFASQQQIPVVTPIWDRGCVMERFRPFLGVIGAASGGRILLSDTDLIIALGIDCDYRVGHLSSPKINKNTPVIKIHTDLPTLIKGNQEHIRIQASPKDFLSKLTKACNKKSCAHTGKWLDETRLKTDDFILSCRNKADTFPKGTNMKHVIDAISKVMTQETLLMVDGGNVGQWFHQLLTDHYPGHWVTCGASGVVGWGMPGAMAAKVLYPDRPVILLSGDGSFTFTVAELECAARQNLPFVAIVADDEMWGISLSIHEKSYGRPLYSSLGPTKLDVVAEGFGCNGIRIQNSADLLPALQKALLNKTPTVIQVPIVTGPPAEYV